MGITVGLGARTGRAQGLWINAIMKRVDVTTKSLGSIKSIKLSGLSGFIAKTIQQLRVDELNISKGFRFLLIINVALCEFSILGIQRYILIYSSIYNRHICACGGVFDLLLGG